MVRYNSALPLSLPSTYAGPMKPCVTTSYPACPHSLGAASALTLIHTRSHLRNSAQEAPKCERRRTPRLASSGKATCLLSHDRQSKQCIGASKQTFVLKRQDFVDWT